MTHKDASSQSTLLSIITITYHDPAGLKRTLASLQPLLSTKIAWEHVVVDSSPEENKSVLSHLSRGWPLVHKITPPQGIYSALNTGTETACGHYIWFLNSGDELKSIQVLQNILEMVSRNPSLDLVCTAADFLKDGKYHHTLYPKSTLEQCILGRNKLCHQGMIYQRSSFLKAGLFSLDYRIASDYEHHFRCYILRLKANCMRERMALCDMGGASHTDWKMSLEERKQIVKKFKPQLPRSFYYKYWIIYAMVYLWNVLQNRLFQPGIRNIFRKSEKNS